LNREYYKCDHTHTAFLDSSLIAKLENYKGRSALKRELLHILVRQLEGISEQETFIRHEFQAIDKNKSGFIERDQLCNAIRESKDNDYDNAKIDSMVDNLDRAKNQKINFSEFLSATIDLNSFLTEDRIQALFSAIDVDQTDQITKQNISDAFAKFGREVSEEELNEIMGEHDINETGYIDKVEFK
tara:strand:+ start:977 stop:1534 length:558 start_codon:yes stop_codon:yes gene_type:complete